MAPAPAPALPQAPVPVVLPAPVPVVVLPVLLRTLRRLVFRRSEGAHTNHARLPQAPPASCLRTAHGSGALAVPALVLLVLLVLVYGLPPALNHLLLRRRAAPQRRRPSSCFDPVSCLRCNWKQPAW